MTRDATHEDTVNAPAAATDQPVEQISEKQFGVAWFYSKRLKLPRDRASLTALAALVPADFDASTPAGKAWIWLTANGRTPTAEEVRARLAAKKDKQKRQQLGTLARRLREGDAGPKAAAFIDDYLAAHGTGPLWREVGTAMGWKPWQVESAMKLLAADGWIVTTAEPRSLRSGPGPTLDVPAQRDTTAADVSVG